MVSVQPKVLCSTPVLVEAFRTALGYMAIAGRDGLLVQVTIGHAAAHEAISVMVQHAASIDTWGEVHEDKWNRRLRDRLLAYALGTEDDFRDVQIDTSHLTPFQRRVVTQCRRIGYGKTCSYGQLAVRAGSPGAARAVGNAMASNRYPLVVPCHRIVASAGLGGFSAGRGLPLKNELLALEQGMSAAAHRRLSPRQGRRE